MENNQTKSEKEKIEGKINGMSTGNACIFVAFVIMPVIVLFVSSFMSNVPNVVFILCGVCALLFGLYFLVNVITIKLLKLELKMRELFETQK